MSVLRSARHPRIPRIPRIPWSSWSSQLRQILPTRLDVRLWAAATQLAVVRRWREAKRKVYPGAQSFGLLTAEAIIVVGAFVLSYVLGWHPFSWTDDVCSNSGAVGCGLEIHLVGTALAVVVVYYLWFLRREARAAARWRRRARNSPEELIEWVSPDGGLTDLAAQASGETAERNSDRPRRRGGRFRRPPPSVLDSAVLRASFVEEIAGELNEDAGPQIIIGDTGSGKTMFLLELSRYLAKHGQVPVPLTLRGANTIDFAEQAREAYLRKAKDREEARKQWEWLMNRQLITILIDDLEQSTALPQERQSALMRAAQDNLRLVVATRPYGLPRLHQRERHVGGRVTLPELDLGDLYEDLKKRAHKAGDFHLDEKLKDLVDTVGMTTTPYYLAVARVLVRIRALDEVPTGGDVQLALVHSYRKAFEDGRVTPDDGLTIEKRVAVFAQLEAIAYFRLLGAGCIRELRDRLAGLQFGSPHARLLETSLDLGRRMGVLEDGHDEQVWFAHPTTMAYFAAEFLRKQSPTSAYAREAIDKCQSSVSPLLMLCLRFASTVTTRGEYPSVAEQTVTAICDRIDRPTEVTEPASINLKLCAVAADILRLWREAPTAAQPQGSTERGHEHEVQEELVSRVLKGAQQLLAVPGRLTMEKRSLIKAVSALDAYKALWQSATAPNQEYPVRREAIRQLLAERPSKDAAVAFMKEQVTEAILAIETSVPQDAPAPDDTDPIFDKFRAVAWILPSLYAQQTDLEANFDHSLERLLALARELTVQLGLESSVAQGIKLDAMANPRAPVQEVALTMLTAPDGACRARFWFSRVLLLQAVTRRYLEAPPLTAPKEVGTVINSIRSDRSEHPFVREAARLCHLAIRKRDWQRYIWSDMTEVAAGARHRLDDAATALIGDIIIALNLNSRQVAKGRAQFATESELPYCLRYSPNRKELLGRGSPPYECAFREERPSAPLVTTTPETRASQHRCLCPYLYEPEQQELNARRELSRAFCRHLRINARPLRWAPEVSTAQLRHFWSRMEDRARF